MASAARLYHAVGRLAYVLVDGHGANLVGHYAPRHGVLYVGYRAAYVGLHGGVLEGAVAVGAEGAVLQHQVVGVTERLLARYVAVDEAQAARMPAYVLAVEHGVVHGDVLHLPESVLGGNLCMVNLHVLDILEHILAVALQPVYVYVAAEHEGVSAAMQLEVLRPYALAPPEHLVGVGHLDVLQVKFLHLAEHLRRVNLRVAHRQVVGVPQGGAAPHVEMAAVNGESVHVPEGVVALEAAVGGHNVAALLYGRLALAYGHVVEVQVVRGEQRALASKLGVADSLHCLYRHFCVIVLLSLPRRPHFAHCARLSHATAAATALFHAAKLQHSPDLRHNQLTDVAPTITCLGIFRVCFDLAARREHNATTKPTTLAIGPSINEQYDGYIRQAMNYTRIEIPFVLFCVIMRHFPNIIVKFAIHIKVCCNEQTNQSAWKL